MWPLRALISGGRNCKGKKQTSIHSIPSCAGRLKYMFLKKTHLVRLFCFHKSLCLIQHLVSQWLLGFVDHRVYLCIYIFCCVFGANLFLLTYKSYETRWYSQFSRVFLCYYPYSSAVIYFYSTLGFAHNPPFGPSSGTKHIHNYIHDDAFWINWI
jgi:hypothetical protein